MHEHLDRTREELDRHSKEIEEPSQLLTKLSEGLHVHSQTHNEAKLCQFYHDFIHPIESKFATALSSDYPNRFGPVSNSIRNRLQFFVECTFTRLAALDQAADLIRDLSPALTDSKSPTAPPSQTLKDLETSKFNKVTKRIHLSNFI